MDRSIVNAQAFYLVDKDSGAVLCSYDVGSADVTIETNHESEIGWEIHVTGSGRLNAYKGSPVSVIDIVEEDIQRLLLE